MEYFSVIDTETNWSNEIMSVGIVIADYKSKMPVHAECYIIDPAYKKGGMYDYALTLHGSKNTALCTKKNCLKSVINLLKKYEVKRIFAYNASFDKKNLPELAEYIWCDIMKIASYRQYNKMIPKNVECYATGKMKRGYSVEGIIRMIGSDKNYKEIHNAYLDAIDELSIIRMLNLDMSVYDNAVI